MKPILASLALILILSSCTTPQYVGAPLMQGVQTLEDTMITQSLFTDRQSTISEEHIQRILGGNYQLPPSIRLSLVKLENTNMRYRYWNDETYLKSQQSYVDLFREAMGRTGRVSNTTLVPDILLPKTPSYTNIREAAVRMQTDAVLIYSITSDLYSRYKLFSKTDIKAFATVQVILMDVRTGLIPFSTITTRDVTGTKKDGDTDIFEARMRVQQEAVLISIKEASDKVNDFLSKK